MGTRYSICFTNQAGEVVSWRIVRLVVSPHHLTSTAWTACVYTLRVPRHNGPLAMAVRVSRKGRRPHWLQLGIMEAQFRTWDRRVTKLQIDPVYINLAERFGSATDTRLLGSGY